VKQGEYKGELSDDWENNSDVAQLLYKEEQKMPAMIALNGATWSEITASDSLPFWEYTADLDTLYDEENLGYKLDA